MAGGHSSISAPERPCAGAENARLSACRSGARLRPSLKRVSLIPLLCVLSAAALLAIVAALSIGSAIPNPIEFWSQTLGDEHSLARTLAFELRLPRALQAFVIGSMLALAGVLMQVLLRNPLADPYVLGISGGAAVGALGAMMIGAAALAGPGAFAGALLSTLVVFAIARADTERAVWAPTRLLLTGVVVAAGWGALIALLLALAPAAQVKGMVYWLLGDLAGASDPVVPLAVLGVTLVAALAIARDLNALSHGALDAAALGVHVPRVSLSLYALAALATAAAVTTAGNVGFVGLIVPHAVRLALGNDQRLLLPASALVGGTLLVIADTAARTVVAPLELPVGVLTALIGVPAFLWLLNRGR
jgi:iron complex transport system permease protein